MFELKCTQARRIATIAVKRQRRKHVDSLFRHGTRLEYIPLLFSEGHKVVVDPIANEWVDFFGRVVENVGRARRAITDGRIKDAEPFPGERPFGFCKGSGALLRHGQVDNLATLVWS